MEKNPFTALMEAINEGPSLQWDAMFARSKNKREKAFKRLMKLNAGVVMAEAVMAGQEEKSKRIRK